MKRECSEREELEASAQCGRLGADGDKSGRCGKKGKDHRADFMHGQKDQWDRMVSAMLSACGAGVGQRMADEDAKFRRSRAFAPALLLCSDVRRKEALFLLVKG